VVLTVNQFFTAGRVVSTSNLLTVLPRHFVASTGIADALDVRPLPLEVPQVHVDMLWHHRQQARAAHAWLRHVLVAAAAAGFKSRAAATQAP
jgi:DNA-binding transcriptional LysR family regulator